MAELGCTNHIANQLSSALFCLLEFSTLAAEDKTLMNLYLGQIKVDMKNMKFKSAFPWDIASTFQSGIMQGIKIKPYSWQFKKAHVCCNFFFTLI